MALCKLSGPGECLADVGFFEVGEVEEQLINSASGGERAYEHAYRDTHSPNARPTAHDVGVHRDAFKAFHNFRLAWKGGKIRSVGS